MHEFAGRIPDVLGGDDLMKPVMDWAQLQERRKAHELAEQKYRDNCATKAARETAENGLTQGTLQKIQREIKLL